MSRKLPVPRRSFARRVGPLSILLVATWGACAPPVGPLPPVQSIIGTTSVGSIPDESFVDDAGQFHWRMSIPVPPGRASMEPHLGIEYRSGGAETSLGVGFSLTGLSGIGRCGHTLAQDGEVRGVQLDAQDGLCLGGERLRPQRGSTTLFHTEHESWEQIEVLTSDANGPTSFVVTDRNGNERRYGSTPDSRITVRRPADGAEMVQAWLIADERDTNGNVVQYTYEHLSSTASDVTWAELPTRDLVRIASIDYTGLVVGGTIAAGTRRVTFEYGAPRGARRADDLTGHIVHTEQNESPDGGFFNGAFGWTPAATPLLRIRTFAQGEIVHLLRLRGGDGTTADGNAQAPALASHEYRLYELQLCAHAPPAEPADRDPVGDPSRSNLPFVCLPSTSFEWMSRFSEQPQNDPAYGFETFEQFDLPYDRISSHQGGACGLVGGFYTCDAPEANPVITLDLNGDGADDILYLAETTGDRRWEARLGVPSPTRTQATVPPGAVPYATGYFPGGLPGAFHHANTLDWNLDGFDDLLVAERTFNSLFRDQLVIYLSNGHSFTRHETGFEYPAYNPLSDGGAPPPDWYSYTDRFELLDLDGDGRQDLLTCLWDSGTFESYRSRGQIRDFRGRWAHALRTDTGFGPLVRSAVATNCAFEYAEDTASKEITTNDDSPVFSYQPALGDFDGDGREELVIAPRWTADSDEDFFQTRILSLRSGILTESTIEAPDPLRGGTPIVADFNGDGLSDLLVNHLSGYWGNPPDPQRDPFDPFFGIHEVRSILRFSTGRFIPGTGSRYTFSPYVRVNATNLTEFQSGHRERATERMIGTSRFRIPLETMAFELNGDGRADLLMATVPSREGSALGCTDSWCELPEQSVWAAEVLGDFEETTDAYPTSATFAGARWTSGAPRPRDGGLRDVQHYRVDADGDGAVDLVEFPSRSPQDADGPTPHLRLFHNVRALPALLTHVRDGHGAFSRIQYTTLADRGTYTPGTTCHYPQRCVTSSHWVVREVDTDAGLANGTIATAEMHQYEDARIDLRGRGFLGFARHVVSRLPSGEITDTRFDNQTFVAMIRDYPFAGRPFHRWTYRVASPLSGEPESSLFVGREEIFSDGRAGSTHPYIIANHGPTYSVLTGTILAREFESVTVPATPASAFSSLPVLRQTQTRMSYDGFDNLELASTTDMVGGATQRVLARWDNSSTPWRVGLLRQVEQITGGSTGCATDVITTLEQDVAHARPTLLTRQPHDRASQRSLEPAYDAFGNVVGTTITTARDGTRATTMPFAADGYFPVSSRNEAGHESLMRYDARLGVLEIERDPNGVITQYAYDGFGRPRTELREGEGELVATYERDGTRGEHGITYSDGAGGRVHVVLDRFERSISEETTLALLTSIVTREYDSLGHTVRETLPRESSAPSGTETVQTYDGLGRLRRTDAPDNVTTHFWFEPQRAHRRQDNGGEYVTVFDSRGLVVQQIEPTGVGASTSYTYCDSGQLRRVLGAGAHNTTEATYDQLGRQIGLDDPSSGMSVFAYDAWDQLIETENAATDKVTFAHDSLGRLIDRFETRGGIERRHAHWQWDTSIGAAGRPVLGALDFSSVTTSVAGLDVTDTYGYDDLGRSREVARQISGLTLVLGVDRDAVGRVNRVTYPSTIGDLPFSLDVGYDSISGEVVRVGSVESPTWELLDEDANGSPLTERIGVITRSMQYTDGGRVSAITSDAPSLALQEITYEYSDRGLLSGRTDHLSARSEKIRHDSMGRLVNVTTADPTSVRSQDFGIDRLGNLRSAGSERMRFADGRHPLRATGYVSSTLSEVLDYDDSGRVIAARGRTYEWNADDLPSNVTDPLIGRIDFAYSADGERAGKTGPDLTLYVGGIYELTRRGMSLVERYHVPTPAGVVATVERTGGANGASDQTRWLLTDNEGSVETTWIPGQAAVHVHYDPFGGVVDGAGNVTGGNPTADVTMGYTTHEHDGELGLINMNGRIYDPRLRRFLTGDPLPTSGTQGLNRYAYVGNRPFDATDPSGWEAAPNDPSDAPTQARVAADPPYWEEGSYHIFGLREASSSAGGTATSGSTGSDSSASESAAAPATGSSTPAHVNQSPTGPLPPPGVTGGVVGGGPEPAQTRRTFADGAADGILGNALNAIAVPSGALEARFHRIYETGNTLAPFLGQGPAGPGSPSFTALGVAAVIVDVEGGIAGVNHVVELRNRARAGDQGAAGELAGGGVVIALFAALGAAGRRAPEDHIMTNKNRVSILSGGPWTPIFEEMARRAGMTLDAAENRVRIPGHRGPHPQAYHEAVFNRLTAATRRLTGEAYTAAFRGELAAIRADLLRVGSPLNRMIRGLAP
jgi:RHS repeat-associated protein